MEFTLPIIYFLFDCHKVPISDRQSQSILILWTDKVIKVASRRGIINMELEMFQEQSFTKNTTKYAIFA